MLYEIAAYPLLVLVGLAAYWLVPAAYRKYVLSALSLAILALVSMRALLCVAFTASVVYVVGSAIRATPRQARRRQTMLLTVGIAVPVAQLAAFKYLPDYSPFARHVLILAGQSGLPLGISYYTFKFVHYLIESRRGTLPAHTLGDFFCYATLFGSFPAGPIERFGAFQPQIQAPRFDIANITRGLERIVLGMSKKVLLVDFALRLTLDLLGDVPATYRQQPALVLYLWLWGRIFIGYLDFSGYCDIAIGTTQLFGIRLMENFNWPLLSGNLAEFWRRWHASLSSWCRDYVYFPVLGLTRRPRLAVVVSMLVLGYWHGPEIRWILWGTWHGLGLALWNAWMRRKQRWPRVRRWSSDHRVAYGLAAWALTMNHIVVGAALLSGRSFAESMGFIVHLVGG